MKKKKNTKTINEQLNGDEIEIKLNEDKDELLEEEMMIEKDLNSELKEEDETEEKITSSVNEIESETEFDVYYKFDTNNHRLEGKHSLKRDTIFNGKPSEVEEVEFITVHQHSSHYQDYDVYLFDASLEKGSIFEEESKNALDIENKKNLSQDVYNLLKEKTDVDFNVNRRKPNKIAFNDYYGMLVTYIGDKYSKSEIFVELSFYFTDNIFNMYKLLDKKHALGIVRELKNKGYLEDLETIKFM